jgi:hypothetical protein
MTPTNYTHDWQMDSYSHTFPSPPPKNLAVAKILSFLKEYDEACLEAKAQMIKKINELLKEEHLSK